MTLDGLEERLKVARKGAGTKFSIAIATAVCAALLGLVGLAASGQGAIYGLACFIVSAFFSRTLFDSTQDEASTIASSRNSLTKTPTSPEQPPLRLSGPSRPRSGRD